MKRSKTLFFVIFGSFLGVLFLLFLIFGFYYYKITNDQTQSLIYTLLSKRASEISESIDTKINDMEAVISSVISQNNVKTLLQHLSETNPDVVKDPDFYEYNDNMILLRESIFSYTGSRKGADQINIYFADDGLELSSGLSNKLSYDNGSLDDLTRQFDDGASKSIFFSGTDADISHFYKSDISKNFISLVRRYENSLDGESLYIEAKKTIIQIISDAVYNQPIYQEEVFLFDRKGTQIYPLSSQGEYGHYFDITNDSPADESKQLFDDPYSHRTVYLIYHTSAYSGMRTVLVIDRSLVTKSIFMNYTKFIPILFMGLFICIAISLLIARRIAKPIKEIYNYVKETDFSTHDSDKLHAVKTRFVEINTLSKAFSLLQTKLKTANERQLSLIKQEMQARMLSLQSQMNPHFLYNSLATIQVMADEGMNDDIINMCQTTSRILRYIASDKEQMVPLGTELSHTRDFLDCMCTRFDHDLTYEINVPESMHDIMIPKLCAQQLVENSVKYSIEVLPPWHISVTGTIDEYAGQKIWMLAIKDNGPGFSFEKQQEIYNQIEIVEKENLLSSLELKGMGLLNIYIRLKLAYSDGFIFCINSMCSVGAEIIIGGRYNDN